MVNNHIQDIRRKQVREILGPIRFNPPFVHQDSFLLFPSPRYPPFLFNQKDFSLSLDLGLFTLNKDQIFSIDEFEGFLDGSDSVDV